MMHLIHHNLNLQTYHCFACNHVITMLLLHLPLVILIYKYFLTLTVLPQWESI